MSLPFIVGTAVQKATPLMDSLLLSQNEQSSHIYIEGSSLQDNANTWTDKKINDAKSLLSQYSKKAIYHGNYRNPIAHEIPQIRDAALEYIKKEVDIARQLNAPLIVHASSLFTHSDRDNLRTKALNHFAEEVNKLSDYAKGQGVEIWLENLEHYSDKRPFYTLYSRSKEYETVLSDVDDYVKMILDYGHENISTDTPWETFEKYIDRIVAISVSNNNGRIDSHSPLDKGTANFEKLLEVIIDNNWVGHVTVETKAGGLKEAMDVLSHCYNSVKNKAMVES